MKTSTDQAGREDQPSSAALTAVPPFNPAYNGVERNAWVFGWNPQQELWNGRLAMLGFAAYVLWDLAGYSVVRDVLQLVH